MFKKEAIRLQKSDTFTSNVRKGKKYTFSCIARKRTYRFILFLKHGKEIIE